MSLLFGKPFLILPAIFLRVFTDPSRSPLSLFGCARGALCIVLVFSFSGDRSCAFGALRSLAIVKFVVHTSMNPVTISSRFLGSQVGEVDNGRDVTRFQNRTREHSASGIPSGSARSSRDHVPSGGYCRHWNRNSTKILDFME